MDEPKSAFKDPKPTAERVVQLAGRVLTGDILLPRFQRNFVWKRKQMLDLLDSISRNYPIGSMLLWQSRQELASERNIAGLEVATTKPDYPVNYLLDGQQRLSTICGALHWAPDSADSVWNLAYDLKAERFVHLDTLDEPALHVVPLRHLSTPSTYFSRLAGLDEDLSSRAKMLFDRFTDYQVAIVTLGDMPIQDVAPVFERINSTGTALTIVDLMRAATWTPTFDLVDAIDSLREDLAPKNFNGIDRKTMLRTVAAAAGLGFEVSAIDDLRNQTEDQLSKAIRETREAAKRASDFLATQIGAPGARALPYANQFAVLCEVFRVIPHPTNDQYATIRRWFWRTTLASYFGGWNTGQMSSDRQAVHAFGNGESTEIANSSVAPTESIWSIREFRANSATSKMLALMLSHHAPVDLITGQAIDKNRSLAWSNDKEFHHFFPKAFLRRKGHASRRANAIGNMVMLTSISNIQIRDKAPSVYLSEVAATIGQDELRNRLDKSLVSEAAYQAALADNFEAFLEARAAHLQKLALALAGLTPAGGVPVDATVASDSVTDDSDSDTSD
ncbi:GmrSD restriction endonuclease domain-containing protein [Nesterenkonia sp. HG001]|uniref:GmrSD restriction endonuclease domain-containing protein n=1 Tax=Nesterenkonia sp. HG001 TaxID=2983207 RepID=UPI002AC4B568|nr:DUF262 domain-containing protein [Nesterenkonia sp. HG001]MDZ5076100.1 DUF262 domain-containing protein [Nesterenkonia sp. HG001]